MRPPVIAIDGTAACGKGTLARLLARHYGFDHLDSGALYRLAALAVLEAGGDPGDPAASARAARSVDPARAGDPKIRTDVVGKAASVLAAMPEVRAALLSLQRDFVARPPGGKGAAIDGRDIGTVIAPDADAKLFVDARPDVRARRRRLELAALGIVRDEAEIRAELIARDAADRSRPISPLLAAPGAMLLDTSDLSIDAAFAAALALVDPLIAPKHATSARGPSEGAQGGPTAP